MAGIAKICPKIILRLLALEDGFIIKYANKGHF
jgi:hypothetical protein